MCLLFERYQYFLRFSNGIRKLCPKRQIWFFFCQTNTCPRGCWSCDQIAKKNLMPFHGQQGSIKCKFWVATDRNIPPCCKWFKKISSTILLRIYQIEKYNFLLICVFIDIIRTSWIINYLYGKAGKISHIVSKYKLEYLLTNAHKLLNKFDYRT